MPHAGSEVLAVHAAVDVIESPNAPRRSRPPGYTLPLLAAANFAAATAGMITAGLLQLIAADLEYSAARVGQLITVYAAGFAIGAPLLGALLGRFCRKHVVLLGLGLVAAGSFATAATQSSPWLESARVLAAAGAAMTLPSVSAIVAHLYAEARPRALGAVLMGLTIAMVLGLPVGTLLGSAFGWRVAFAAAGLLAIVVAVVLKLALPGGIVVPTVGVAAWRELLRAGSTYVLLLPSVLFSAANFALYAYVAVYLAYALGSGANELAGFLLLFGVASICANLAIGVASDRVGAARLLAASCGGLALTMVTMAGGAGNAGLVIAAFVAWAFCNAFFLALQQTRVVDAHPAAATALLALNNSATFAGQAAGSIVGSAVLATLGPAALPWAGCALAVGAWAATARAGRRTR